MATSSLQVITQAPYAGGAPVVTPLTISFNVPMSEVKAGGFAGANEPAFPASVGRLIKGKIGIVIDMETVPAVSRPRELASSVCLSLCEPHATQEHGRTPKLSSQVNASTNITKGRLASIIVGEVERAFVSLLVVRTLYIACSGLTAHPVTGTPGYLERRPRVPQPNVRAGPVVRGHVPGGLGPDVEVDLPADHRAPCSCVARRNGADSLAFGSMEPAP